MILKLFTIKTRLLFVFKYMLESYHETSDLTKLLGIS